MKHNIHFLSHRVIVRYEIYNPVINSLYLCLIKYKYLLPDFSPSFIIIHYFSKRFFENVQVMMKAPVCLSVRKRVMHAEGK